MILETLITARSFFKYCLEGFNPNGWRPGDNQEVVVLVGALFEGAIWPHDSFDQLAQILLGYMSEPFNFFYHFCQMKLHLFAFAKFAQGGYWVRY